MNEHDSIADAGGRVIDVHRNSSEPAGGVQPPSDNPWLPTLVGTLGLLLTFDLLIPPIITIRSQFVFSVFAIAVIVQVALHAAWIVLGPGHFWWRIGSVPLFVALVAWMTSALPEPDQLLIQLVLFEHWLLVAACLFPLRARNFRVRPESLAAESPAPANQFSISYLFGLLTLASFVIGVATRINDVNVTFQDPSLWFAAAILLVITVPPFPAVLMPRDPWPWWLGAFFLPIVVIVLLSAAFAGNSEVRGLLIFTASMSAAELVLLAVFRLAGFRLRRPGGDPPASEPVATTGEKTGDHTGDTDGPAPLQSA